jgi:hypothetical protein
VKNLVLYASHYFNDDKEFRAGVSRFMQEHNWTSVCLISPLTHPRLRRMAISLALDEVEGIHIFHQQQAAPRADTMRKRLCTAAEGALIFWDGRSAGTRKMIDMVEQKDIPFAVHIL